MSCLARGVSPLYRKNKETHLIYREERGRAIGRGKARGRGKAKARARQALLYIEKRETLSLHKRESVTLL
jgi:hypothetical protein